MISLAFMLGVVVGGTISWFGLRRDVLFARAKARRELFLELNEYLDPDDPNITSEIDPGWRYLNEKLVRFAKEKI